MQICDDGHDEICYEGKKCPLCEAFEQVEELEKEVSDLEDEVAELQETSEEVEGLDSI